VSSIVQLLGFLLAVAGLAVLFGAWALVAGGVLLVVVPEMGALVAGRSRDRSGDGERQ
jgi:hypothetical protein